ncbi:alpha/beta fold hydrolase [Cellulosilyticum ruminicola]|uniref:alpha/beta fold hydrolase n=1 Tax=Cellulosilyticum ruminicola TaxID=425254 RepID=UPI0006D091DC|nr:alpha/beta hydrolase [Cellulosilyticum ruminicola]
MKKQHIKYPSILVLLLVISIAGYFTFNTTNSVSNMTLLDTSLNTNAYVLSEDNFEEQMLEVVEPYIASVTTSGYFISNDYTDIYYEYYTVPSAKGNIVVSHGFTESLEKYTELAYYFLQEGFNVYIIDHRGHGLSERTTSDLSLVDVKSFDNYINDLYTFINEFITSKQDDLPLFLFAHSMGGGIGTGLLEAYPDLFDGAVLSSPMLGINLGSVPKFAANIISNTATLLGQGSQYIISHNPFNLEYETFDASSSSSLARFNYYLDKKINNKHLQTSGASYSWLKEALYATHNMIKPENLERITTPILLFQSENDSLVLPGPQYALVNNVPSAELIFVPEAKHELFSTPNELFIPYLNTVLDFYTAHIE